MLDRNIKQEPDNNDSCFALGRQLTIEYYECSHEKLLSKDIMEKALLKAAKESGATIISSSFHNFEPQGVSGVVIIAESHFTVHAWPEHDYAAVDIFTCGDSIDLETALNSLKDSLESKNIVVSSDQNRGIISRPERQVEIKEAVNSNGLYPISWKKDYERQDPWGVQSSIDIYDCDPGIIRDKESIKSFTDQLCNLIKMKRYGDCQVVHFGEDEKVAGFSMTQLIETSLISGHFANASNAAYIDVFSCKFYEPREVAEFAMTFFKGSNYKLQIAYRK